jgi:hypothetical protein
MNHFTTLRRGGGLAELSFKTANLEMLEITRLAVEERQLSFVVNCWRQQHDALVHSLQQ